MSKQKAPAHKPEPGAFEPSHPKALAIYCSDGRFTDAVEGLLHSLGHARLDTLTVPGGPCLLDLNTANFSELEALRAAASFLIRGHRIERVVLLAHEGCGFYRERMKHIAHDEVTARQCADLRSSAEWLLRTHADLAVDMYYARISSGRVTFDPIPALAEAAR